MLLSEGMKIKVLQLPDGEDPDSFSQTHTLTEIQDYIDTNETDFIRFKTKILLEGAENDPIKRANVISDIVRSIACIPDNISRAVYIGECSRLLDIDEKILRLEVDKAAAKLLDAGKTIPTDTPATTTESYTLATPPQRVTNNATSDSKAARQLLNLCERELLRYVLKYGMLVLCDAVDENNNSYPMLLIEFVNEELSIDSIAWTNPDYAITYQTAVECWLNNWEHDKTHHDVEVSHALEKFNQEGLEAIKNSAIDLAEIKKQETDLLIRCEKYKNELDTKFTDNYLELRLASSPDDTVRRVTTDLVSEKHQLSKVHTKYTKIETERDKLVELVPKAIAAVKDAHLALMLKEERDQLSQLNPDDADYSDKVTKCMTNINQYTLLRMELARNLGERVIVPRR